MEREVGGGIGMGNTCKPMADSFQCMTKPTTVKKTKKQNNNLHLMYFHVIFVLTRKFRTPRGSTIKRAQKFETNYEKD